MVWTLAAHRYAGLVSFFMVFDFGCKYFAAPDFVRPARRKVPIRVPAGNRRPEIFPPRHEAFQRDSAAFVAIGRAGGASGKAPERNPAGLSVAP